jgi:hypothetical protein
MMKLSEAIRLGAMSVKDNRKRYLEINGDDACGCALGAAAYAIGRKTLIDENDSALRAAFPLLDLNVTERRSDFGGSLAIVISALHYSGTMTRQQIADWVETIENEQEAKLCTTTLTTPNSSTCQAISQHSLAEN